MEDKEHKESPDKPYAGDLTKQWVMTEKLINDTTFSYILFTHVIDCINKYQSNFRILPSLHSTSYHSPPPKGVFLIKGASINDLDTYFPEEQSSKVPQIAPIHTGIDWNGLTVHEDKNGLAAEALIGAI